MVCFGLEPGAAGWKAQMNPLSYGGTPNVINFIFFQNLFWSDHNSWFVFSVWSGHWG